jgi:hypothetical protein
MATIAISLSPIRIPVDVLGNVLQRSERHVELRDASS